MKLIIYLPAYNEEEKIQEVLNNLPKSLDGVEQIQLLVVDDGSSDKTVELARLAGANVVGHKYNQGVGAAFISALKFAIDHDADILVSIDADGQFNSEEIPNIVKPILSQQADMVIGNRFALGFPQNMPKIRYWGNKQISKIIGYICGQKFEDVSCGFRAYSRDLLLILNPHGSFTYTHETILSAVYHGKNVVEVPIKVKYYPNRKSRVAESIFKYAIQTSIIVFRVIIDYRPVQVFGILGLALILIGSGFTLFLLGHYFLTNTFTPYKSYGFIGLGFFIFGFLVLLLALISDMIKRLRVNQDRILYNIKKYKYGK